MATEELETLIPLPGVKLPAIVALPEGLTAAVVFAHAAGSDRYDLSDGQLARALRAAGIGTVQFDLLTFDEREAERETQHLRFDLELLAERIDAVAAWLLAIRPGLTVGLCAAGTGAAAALMACARHGQPSAVVSRAGQPDLAGPALGQVRAATLLLVAGGDAVSLRSNHEAFASLRGPSRLEIIQPAARGLDDLQALEQVAGLARAWFVRWLSATQQTQQETHAPW